MKKIICSALLGVSVLLFSATAFAYCHGGGYGYDYGYCNNRNRHTRYSCEEHRDDCRFGKKRSGYCLEHREYCYRNFN